MSLSTLRGASFDVARGHRFTQTSSGVVVGIDLATTRCCLATGLRFENENEIPWQSIPTPQLCFCWDDTNSEGTRWPPTALLYRDDGTPRTGSKLETEFKGPLARHFDMKKYFRQWKLLFHDSQNNPNLIKIQDQLNAQLVALGKERTDLLEDWVRLTYDQLFIEGKDGLYSLRGSHGHFKKEDIEIAVTVPPGRSVLAHNEVRGGFIQGPIGPGQVSLVSEPEAMFRSWIHDAAQDKPDDFKVGNRYLFVDGGGGTCSFVDFGLLNLEPLKLEFRQEYGSESTVYGAETISNKVEEMLGNFVPASQPNRPYVLDQLRRQFDEWYKAIFGDDDYKTFIFKFLDSQGSEKEIIVERQKIKACFDECISPVSKIIKRQIRKGPAPKFLVLGGGLFNSPYVKSYVAQTFSPMDIRSVSADKGHVARGAVLVRTCAPFITERPIFRSRAVITWEQVTPKIKKLNKRLKLDLDIETGRDGKDYYRTAQFLAKQGTEADVTHALDVHEVESESSYANARTRSFTADQEDLAFSDTILTFNYSPGRENFLMQLKGGGWVTSRGESIPDPEDTEDLIWDLKGLGVDLDGLDEKSDAKGVSCRVVHYSIQMRMSEVQTEYWIKAWSFVKSVDGYHTELKTHRFQTLKKSEGIFGSQVLSQNLADSYRLGGGLEKRKLTEDGGTPSASQVLEGRTSNQPESPSRKRRIDWSLFRQRTDPVPSSLVTRASSSRERLPASPATTPSGVERTAPTHRGRGKKQCTRSTSPVEKSLVPPETSRKLQTTTTKSPKSAWNENSVISHARTPQLDAIAARLRISNQQPGGHRMTSASCEDEDEDIFDVSLPPWQMAQPPASPQPGGILNQFSGEGDVHRRRYSSRQQAPRAAVANMVSWDDIDEQGESAYFG